MPGRSLSSARTPPVLKLTAFRLIAVLACAFAPPRATPAVPQLNVSVCNYGNVPEYVLGNAEKFVAEAFQAFAIDVAWNECGAAPASEIAVRRHWLTFRLLSRKGTRTRDLSLDTMGLAYVPEDGEGNLADIYYANVRNAADTTDTDPGYLFGCVMVHEIGHLLLGRAHSVNGVMRPKWKSQDLDQLRKHWLTFESSQRVRIQAVLTASTATGF